MNEVLLALVAIPVGCFTAAVLVLVLFAGR